MTFQDYIHLKIDTKFKLLGLKAPIKVIDMLYNRVNKDLPESIYEIIWFEGWPIGLRLIKLYNIEKRENGYLITQYEHGCFTSSLMTPNRLIIFSKKDFLKNKKSCLV